MDHRSTHYFLWFVFFGVVAGLNSLLVLNHGLDSTSIWFLVAGLLGLIVTRKELNEGKLAKPYDIIIGLIFAIVGVIGILAAFHVDVLKGVSASPFLSSSSILGLSTSSFFVDLVYAVLGFQSLNHGLKKAGKK